MKKVKVTIQLNEIKTNKEKLSLREQLLLEVDSESAQAELIQENNKILLDVYRKVFKSYLELLAEEIDPMYNLKEIKFYRSDEKIQISLPALYYGANSVANYNLMVVNCKNEYTSFKSRSNIYIIPELTELSVNDLILVRSEYPYGSKVVGLDTLKEDYKKYFFYKHRTK